MYMLWKRWQEKGLSTGFYGILTLNCGNLVLTKDRNNNDCTCKFSTIVVEKDEYRDGHHEPDQKPPVFSFLVACLKNTTIPRRFKLSFHWIFKINFLTKIHVGYILHKVDNLLTISLTAVVICWQNWKTNSIMTGWWLIHVQLSLNGHTWEGFQTKSLEPRYMYMIDSNFTLANLTKLPRLDKN